jgi:hypothetical protein
MAPFSRETLESRRVLCIATQDEWAQYNDLLAGKCKRPPPQISEFEFDAALEQVRWFHKRLLLK